MTTMEALVNRFLGWKLPKTFGPDAGITFKPSNGMTREEAYERPGWWPIGTNLLNAEEAKQMLEHLLGTPTRTWVVAKQHPDRAEVSMFTTTYEGTAKEYEALGWTVRPIEVLPPTAGVTPPSGVERIEQALRDQEAHFEKVYATTGVEGRKP